MRSRSFHILAVMLVASMAFSVGLGTNRARAQDDALTAAVVSGSCDNPGDVVGELRDLAEAEGGVLTSFTRISVGIGDLTGDDHAVLVSSGGDAVACGDISGEGDDVYVGVTAQSSAGYGGIAWLHARDESTTQVSLFIDQGLSGASATGDDDDDVTPPDDDDTPPTDDDDTPPGDDDDTPPGDDDDTPADGTTYESPSFGYTVTYDETWENLEEATTPTDNGPQDFLHLFNGTSHAYFYTNAADDDFPMDQIPDILLGRLESSESLSEVEVRLDDNGDEIRGNTDDTAFIAVNFIWTNQDGQSFELYDHYQVYRIPGQGAILIFLNEGLQRAYDQQAPAREKLADSIVIPN